MKKMNPKYVITLLTVGMLALTGCSEGNNSIAESNSSLDYLEDTMASESTVINETELTESTEPVEEKSDGPIITKEDYFVDYPLKLNSGKLVYVGRVPGFDIYTDVSYKIQDQTVLDDYKENDVLALFPDMCEVYGMQFVSGCEMCVLHNAAGYYIDYWANYTATEIESFDNGLHYTLYEMDWNDGNFVKYVLIANIGEEEIVVELPKHKLDEVNTVNLLNYYKNSEWEPLVISDDYRIGKH